jgi:predicted dehydrogenase
VVVDVVRECVWLYRADGRERRLALRPGDGAYDPSGPASALVDAALGRPDAADPAPGDLGARTVEVLDAAYRSAASGRPEAVA